METKKTSRLTNKTFAQTDKRFLNACELANIPATKRQASKFRRNFGLAYDAITRSKKNV